MNIYPKIARNVILPLADIATGTKISKYLKFLEKTQWWSREELQEYQNKKLRALIKHAYENVPYYHRIFRENNLTLDDIKTTEDLVKLPIITKDVIRANFPDDIVSKKYNQKKIILSSSSGSTGEPLQYFSTKSFYSQIIAAELRGWGWMGYRVGDRYIKISVNPRRILSKRIQDRLMRCSYIHLGELNDKSMEKCVKAMRQIRPKIIRGYPVPMFILVKFMKRNNIDDIRPKAITTTGETLFGHHRKAIESQFDCKIFDEYGGEGVPKVFECEEHDGYHIAIENGYIEILKNNDLAAPGERGEIIVTNFENYATPFIRYKINDIGVLSDEKCPCGRGLPLLKSILGRDTDIITTPHGGLITNQFFLSFFEWFEGIDQFQVIQEKLDKITIKIAKNSKFSGKDLNKIQTEVQKYVGNDINLYIKFVDKIPLAKSGKRRFVISKVKPEL